MRAAFIGELYCVSCLAVAGAPAVRAGDVHIRQELYIKTDNAGSVAAGATERPGVVGKITGLVAEGFGIRRLRIKLAQLVVDACIGCHSGADVDADGRGVHELDVCNAVGIDCADVGRQRTAADLCLQCRNQALQYHSGLAGARYPGDNCEPSFWNIDLQGLYGMDPIRGQVNPAVCKEHFLFDAGA